MKIIVSLFALFLCSCNGVRVDSQPAGASVTVNQSIWKANAGQNNRVDAVTSPATQVSVPVEVGVPSLPELPELVEDEPVI